MLSAQIIWKASTKYKNNVIIIVSFRVDGAGNKLSQAVITSLRRRLSYVYPKILLYMNTVYVFFKHVSFRLRHTVLCTLFHEPTNLNVLKQDEYESILEENVAYVFIIILCREMDNGES